MAVDALVVHDQFKGYMGDGAIDLASDSFIARLFLSTSDLSRGVGTGLAANPTNEHANANGYTTGGFALASPTWTETSAGTYTFDTADEAPYATASGGSIVARYWCMIDDTPTTPLDPIVGFVLMDDSPADITVTDTNDLNITVAATGWFTLSGAETG